MPEGQFGRRRLFSFGPLVRSDWELAMEDVDITSEIIFDSSENMDEVDDNSIHLAVTSPPYNIGWDYGSFDDDQEFSEYTRMMRNVFDEVYAKLTQQGRFCIVAPTLVRAGAEGGFSHIRHFMNIVEESSNDWRKREVIIWDKKSGKPPRYSTFPEPWGVLLNNVNEGILVLQKPGRRRTYQKPSKRIRDLSEYNNAPADVATDVWEIPVQESFMNFRGERVPTYPDEIPRRLIKLYSFFSDTVLDPFAGSGTTLKVAAEEGRNSIGYELRDDLAPVIEQRVSNGR